ncbi:MAG: hypothetical protein U0R19_36100 [Bryobacteraceae bacterium]
MTFVNPSAIAFLFRLDGSESQQTLQASAQTPMTEPTQRNRESAIRELAAELTRLKERVEDSKTPARLMQSFAETARNHSSLGTKPRKNSG